MHSLALPPRPLRPTSGWPPTRQGRKQSKVLGNNALGISGAACQDESEQREMRGLSMDFVWPFLSLADCLPLCLLGFLYCSNGFRCCVGLSFMKIVLESRSFVHLYIVARCDGPYLTVYGVYGCAFYVKLVQRRRSRKFVVCGEIFARAAYPWNCPSMRFLYGYTRISLCESLLFGCKYQGHGYKIKHFIESQYNWLLEEHLRRSFR